MLNEFQYHYLVTMISLICRKIHYLSVLTYCLVYDQIHLKLFERLVIIIHFLSCKVTTSIYLLKILITHKNWISKSNPIAYTGSAPQMLSLKEKHTLQFSNFLIIDFCYSSVDCWWIKNNSCSCVSSRLLNQKVCKPLK